MSVAVKLRQRTEAKQNHKPHGTCLAFEEERKKNISHNSFVFIQLNERTPKSNMHLCAMMND